MKLLLVMSMLLLVPYESLAHPVFGTKRYGRTGAAPSPHPGWGAASPSYYVETTPRMHYLDHDYYYQPLYYYGAPMGMRGVYQPPPPPPYYAYGRYGYGYGYGYGHGPRNAHYYDDPVDDLQEEMHQEDEREEALPVGQEMWYENDADGERRDDSIDDVNAAFLQNLMLYNDAMADADVGDDYYRYEEPETSGNIDDGYAIDAPYAYYAPWTDTGRKHPGDLDEDVKELKMLQEEPKKQRKAQGGKKQRKERKGEAEQRIRMLEKGAANKKTPSSGANDSEAWIKWSGDKRAVTGATTSTMTTTTTPSAGEIAQRDARRGQKEVVLVRPATPVRRPFSEPVMQLLQRTHQQPERKRTPSVYDTIKHLLEMEKSLEQVSAY